MKLLFPFSVSELQSAVWVLSEGLLQRKFTYRSGLVNCGTGVRDQTSAPVLIPEFLHSITQISMSDKNKFSEAYKKRYAEIEPTVLKNVGRVYIICFNAYAWYWIFAHGADADWESWVQSVFAWAGMHYFYLDKKKEYRFGPPK